MIFYYDNISYKCKWKSLMKKDMWYSMEPVRLKVEITTDIYDKILYDIKVDRDNKTLGDILRFKVIGREFEFTNNDSTDEKVLLIVESFLDRICILSKIKNKITVQFDVSIYERKLGDKSDLRELLINQLVKSENQE